MSVDSLWVAGSTRSGKTTRLIEQLQAWASSVRLAAAEVSQVAQPFLVFAATGDNRLELADRIAAATQGREQVLSTTPLGFLQDEVMLFAPLLAQRSILKVQFPVRLRPETEQQLATQLWQPELASGRLRQEGVSDYFMVRRSLDLLQLAAASGTPAEEIPTILKQGFAGQEEPPDLWECIGDVVLRWRHWCLDRGLLTYGIMTELYWRHLLPDRTYQAQLRRRYRAVLADDVDEYPAITRLLFNCLLDGGVPGAFTYNPEGGIRVGLGADPQALVGLADRCQTVTLAPPPQNLGATWGAAVVEWISNPLFLPELPEVIQTIYTSSRAQLLRQTAEAIVAAVHSGQVQPQEIAVIGAGVDAIARYTLREILTSRGIAVESLNDQQPLVSSLLVRALLTLMALVYGGLGRLLHRDAIAEMLVVLSQVPAIGAQRSGLEQARIDPVRAGLLTDYCFAPDPDRPRLLPATTFPRWDRLGYQATQAYTEIVQWIEDQHQQHRQRLLPNPLTLLDRAIQRFLFGGSHLPYDQVAVLRELIETAQHYWEVDDRVAARAASAAAASKSAAPDLNQVPRSESSEVATSVGQFIQLLRDGTITADPFPVRAIGKTNPAVTIATIYQYRSTRRCHRWHFWLDVGSAFWLTGGAPLFGAPLFLQTWSGRSWTAADTLAADQLRLRQQVLDLLSRVSGRIYLCHSELATNGQEQTGPLLTLANAALPVFLEEVEVVG